jgi:tetratricopeptide (TPR) repeat protein
MFDKMVVGELLGLFKKTAGRLLKPEFEENEIINRAYQALENACDSFFKKYGKKFGSLSESFLARQANLDILIKMVFPGSGDLGSQNLNPAGFDGAQSASKEALDFFVNTYKAELVNDNLLMEKLDTKEVHQLIRNSFKKDEISRYLTPLPPRNVKLVGREKELYDLKRLLDQSQLLILVNGLGGVGKTELCRSFFYSQKDDFKFLAWVDYLGSIKKSFVRSFTALKNGFRDKKPSEKDYMDKRYRKVIESLRNLGDELLLVIDNLDNAQDEDMGDIFRLPGKVLANSRLKLEKFDHYDLDFLEPTACRELFYRFYKREKDDMNLDRVLELAGYHTLTVELLARTAHSAPQSIADLRNTLEKKGFNLNEVIQRDVTTLWNEEEKKRRFFDHILKVFPLSGLEEEEKYILMNLSLLPSVFINIKQICRWLGLADNKGINTLVEKGWLKEEGWEIFLHQVMADAVYYQSNPNALKAKNLITLLGSDISCKPGESRLERQPLLHFADSVVMRLKNEKDKELAGLLINLSLLYQALGQFNRALDYQLKAIDIFKEVLSPDQPELAVAFNNVAMIYQDLGLFEQALDFELKCIEIREKVLPKNDFYVAQSYNNLAMIYKDFSQLNQMFEYMKKAIEIYEEILPADDPELELAYNNLALCYDDLGQFQLALRWQLKANKICEKIYHDAHPKLAKSYNNISYIYQSLGELEQALEFQLKSIEIKERIYPKKDHIDMALSYNNLSTIYCDMNKVDQALEFQLKTVEIRKKTLPGEHHATAAAFNNLSEIYLRMGNFDQALKFQLQSIEIKEKVLPENHRSLANSYRVLSKIFSSLNRRAEALDYSRRAVVILKESLPKGHPEMDKSRQNLAENYYNLGNAYFDDSKMREAIEAYNKAIENKPDYHQAWLCKGVALAELGQPDEALKACNKALEFKPDLHKACLFKGAALATLGLYNEALDACNKAIELKPNDYLAWYGKGNALAASGRREESLEAYNKAIEIKPDYHSAWYNLACLYSSKKETGKALESLQKAIDNGFNNLSHIMRNKDLDIIRNEKEFQEMIGKSRQKT